MASAKEYPTDRIRNVVVVGHGGSGKTSLIDSLCFVSGSSKRHGSVGDGTALTMHAPEEIAHGISIQLTPAYAEHMDVKINLLDTPGYLDFAGETISTTATTISTTATTSCFVTCRTTTRRCFSPVVCDSPGTIVVETCGGASATATPPSGAGRSIVPRG